MALEKSIGICKHTSIYHIGEVLYFLCSFILYHYHFLTTGLIMQGYSPSKLMLFVQMFTYGLVQQTWSILCFNVHTRGFVMMWCSGLQRTCLSRIHLWRFIIICEDSFLYWPGPSHVLIYFKKKSQERDSILSFFFLEENAGLGTETLNAQRVFRVGSYMNSLRCF